MAGFGNRRFEKHSGKHGNKQSDKHIIEHEQIETLAGFSTIRLAIGFCIAGLLGALFLTPVLDNGARTIAIARNTVFSGPVDSTVTGGIEKAKKARRYTIRRSVMQKDPSVPCYIFEDGSREGGC